MRNDTVFGKNLHSWHKFYTTAGRDGRDKSQLYSRGKGAIDISNGILMAPLDYMISKEDTCREIWKIKYVL